MSRILKRMLTSSSAVALALVVGMGQASAGLFDTLIPNTINTYEDQNRESIVDVDGDNALSPGDVAIGFVRLDTRSIPAGLNLGGTELYAVFTQQAIDVQRVVDVPTATAFYVVTLAPPVAGPLSLSSLLPGLPAPPAGSTPLAALFRDIGSNLILTNPGDADGSGATDIFDFIKFINDTGDLELVVGFDNPDDFWEFRIQVPVAQDAFDNLASLGALTLAGGIPGGNAFQAGLSILFSAGGPFTRGVLANATGTFHDLVIANGDVSGAADLVNGLPSSPFFGTVDIQGLDCAPGCNLFGLSSNADFSVFPIDDVPPEIVVNKRTNGIGADGRNSPNIPQIAPGDTVNWEYEVRNTGDVQLVNVMVRDDHGTPGDPSDDLCTPNTIPLCVNPTIVCPATVLEPVPGPDNVMTCTASGMALDLDSPPMNLTPVPGLCAGIPNRPLYENMAVATGESVLTGAMVMDDDPSHYCNPPEGNIVIVKLTNGLNANDPDGVDVPRIAPGNTVTWTYQVTNTGLVPFNAAVVVVTDNQPGVNPVFDSVLVGDADAVLEPGETWGYTASLPAENLLLPGPGVITVPGVCTANGVEPPRTAYTNIGTVTVPGASDNDPSSYCNPPPPAIDIEKSTNGVDADSPNAGNVPQIAPGDLVSWTYKVKNIGFVPLVNVTVVDDQGVTVNCPKNTLAVAEMMICTASATAEDLTATVFTTVQGLCGGVSNQPLYENRGTATGSSLMGDFVQDVDPSHYCNPPVVNVAACVSTDAETSITRKQTKIFNVKNFFNVNPQTCPTGFILAYAKDDSLGAKTPIEFNALTGSLYIRGQNSGKLAAGAERAYTIQADPTLLVDQGDSLAQPGLGLLAQGGAFPAIPFDGVAYRRIPERMFIDFRAPDQAGTTGSVLSLLDVDINRTIQNSSRLLAVDVHNQAEVSRSGTIQFRCHIRTPLQNIPGIGTGLLQGAFGSSFGKLELELSAPPDDGGVLGLLEEFEPNRMTLRKLHRSSTTEPSFLGEQPGSVVIYPLFRVNDPYKTTIRLTNTADEEVEVQFFRVCGQGPTP